MEEGSDSGEEEEHMGEVVVVDNQMMGACLLLAATAEGDSLLEMVSVATLFSDSRRYCLTVVSRGNEVDSMFDQPVWWLPSCEDEDGSVGGMGGGGACLLPAAQLKETHYSRWSL